MERSETNSSKASMKQSRKATLPIHLILHPILPKRVNENKAKHAICSIDSKRTRMMCSASWMIFAYHSIITSPSVIFAWLRFSKRFLVVSEVFKAHGLLLVFAAISPPYASNLSPFLLLSRWLLLVILFFLISLPLTDLSEDLSVEISSSHTGLALG